MPRHFTTSSFTVSIANCYLLTTSLRARVVYITPHNNKPLSFDAITIQSQNLTANRNGVNCCFPAFYCLQHWMDWYTHVRINGMYVQAGSGLWHLDAIEKCNCTMIAFNYAIRITIQSVISYIRLPVCAMSISLAARPNNGQSSVIEKLIKSSGAWRFCSSKTKAFNEKWSKLIRRANHSSVLQLSRKNVQPKEFRNIVNGAFDSVSDRREKCTAKENHIKFLWR